MKYFILSLLLAGPLRAAAGEPNLPLALPAATVLRVNNEAITSARVFTTLDRNTLVKYSEWAGDVDFNTFHSRVRETLGRRTGEIIREQLFYQFAYKDLEKTDKFEEILKKAEDFHRKRLLALYDGNEAKAQNELAARGISVKEKLEDDQRQFIFRSYWEKHYEPATELTPTQMLQYYRKHLKDKYLQPASIQFQLIEIQVRPFLPAGMSYPTQEDLNIAREKAAQAAAAALAELEAGGDFGAVVKKYSNGFRKENAGIWPAFDPAGLQTQYQPLVEPLKKLAPGQRTGLIETPDRFFIAKLLEYKEAGVIPFAEVQDQIAKVLKIEIQNKNLLKLTETMLAKATIGSLDNFLSETAQAIYHFLRQHPVKE